MYGREILITLPYYNILSVSDFSLGGQFIHEFAPLTKLKILTQILAIEALNECLIVRLGDDFAPPGLIVHIPADCLLQRRLELIDGLPAQRPEFTCVDAVALIVRPTARIPNGFDKYFRLTEQLEQAVCDLQVVHLAVRADV